MGDAKRLGGGEGKEAVAAINTFMESLRSWWKWRIGYW